MMHKAKLFWFPGTGHYEIRCVECGKTLVDIPESIEAKPFDFPGECEPPKNTLGISVSETIAFKDKVG